MPKVIGIDLGTTNSCVAFVDNGIPTVIPGKGGQKILPSVVAITAQGKRMVGQSARRQAITNPENTVFGAKRYVGRTFDDPVVQAAIISSPFNIVEGGRNDPRILLQGKPYTMAEISAMILSELKTIAEEHLGEKVEKAVLTVPAYFREPQRAATRDAGRVAGLEVLRVLNEPTAAALAYGFGKDRHGKVAVYDLGGGTFDISILEIDGTTYEVLTSNGDTFLGGEDFDSRIMEWLFDEFESEHSIDLREDAMAVQRLKDAAEQAKIHLSTVFETEVNLPFIATRDGEEAVHLHRKLTRQMLEEMVVDMVTRTVDICERALRDAMLTPERIDAVLLVGGQTRMPLVQQMVARFFGKQPQKTLNPDEAVALGAAIQANLLAGVATGDRSRAHGNALLLDLTPFSLGVQVSSGMYQEIIPKDTPIPVSKTHVFTTEKDNQTVVRVRAMQTDARPAVGGGSIGTVVGGTLLGEIMLPGLTPAPRGETQIKVLFDLDADGTLSVRAVDTVTGEQKQLVISSQSYIPERELAGMIEDNRDYLLEQEAQEQAKRLEVRIQGLVSNVNRALPDLERKLAGAPGGSEALTRVRVLVGQAEMALATGEAEHLAGLEEPLRRIQALLESR